MPEEKRSSGKHTVVMDGRQNIEITGVNDVISFDEETIIADTELGILVLRGSNLHVNRLNLDNGELEVDGEISNLTYEEDSGHGKGKSSLLSKLFR